MEKNDAQISGVAVVKKAPSPWRKNISKKKSFQVICTIRPANCCVELFQNKWVSRYLTFADFLFPKNCSSPENY